MATKAQIRQWKEELKRDFPTCEPYFIDLVCDIYEKNPEYMKKLPKKKFKPVENTTPAEIMGAVQVLNNPSDEILNKYFKKPLVIEGDETEDKTV